MKCWKQLSIFGSGIFKLLFILDAGRTHCEGYILFFSFCLKDTRMAFRSLYMV